MERRVDVRPFLLLSLSVIVLTSLIYRFTEMGFDAPRVIEVLKVRLLGVQFVAIVESLTFRSHSTSTIVPTTVHELVMMQCWSAYLVERSVALKAKNYLFAMNSQQSTSARERENDPCWTTITAESNKSRREMKRDER